MIGIGLVLLLAGSAIRNETFSVGDFALFMSYIWNIVDFVRNIGSFVGDYQGQSVRIERLEAMTESPLAESLLANRPVYLRKDPPPLAVPVQASAPLHTLDVQNLTYRYPSSGRGIEAVDLHIERGDFVVITGRVGGGQEHAAACPPRPAAQRWRKRPLERRNSGRSRRLFYTTAGRLHAANAASL